MVGRVVAIAVSAVVAATAASAGTAAAAPTAVGSATSTAAGAPASVWAAPTRVVADPRNGHHVVVHRGTTVDLMLTACEDCGYSWNVSARPVPSVVRYVSRASTGSGVCPTPCVGGNAVEHFLFTAAGYGETSVRLAYRGPGSTGVTRRLTVWFVVVRQGRSALAALHYVHRGDTLYSIARAALHTRRTDARVRALVSRIYRDNHEVIGPDRDLLLPGEILLVDPTGIR